MWLLVYFLPQVRSFLVINIIIFNKYNKILRGYILKKIIVNVP
jgi:hypothetical protein